MFKNLIPTLIGASLVYILFRVAKMIGARLHRFNEECRQRELGVAHLDATVDAYKRNGGHMGGSDAN